MAAILCRKTVPKIGTEATYKGPLRLPVSGPSPHPILRPSFPTRNPTLSSTSMADTYDDDDTTSSVGSPDFTDVSDIPVGLSDPQCVRRKRKMLDAVNRLRAIG